MIIGLTGTIAAGKTTVARLLEKRGFEVHTYSDLLRDIAKERGIPTTRESLQKLGTEIKRDDPGILSRMLVERAESRKIVADGVRTVAEIRELRTFPDAFVLGVTASQEERFSRLRERARPGDPRTLTAFQEIDTRENSGEGQNILACLEQADRILENSGTLKELEEKLSLALRAWGA